ncbi:DUF6498-containing protein [Pontiella agarivorans]|uniref:DUF6498-containing protein n=1 Tax=Pontiella agarivorans TaxID=3038953 RepID=A0ABU5MXG0_9BACT|nr:DUF6498-containing protein [Pontiella agarivorans]MDZ8118847.1 DUF6498-containing protein [Pontiella agarivorans]
MRILPDLLGFAGGLAAAYFLQWETGDLVWSLWFCSLMVGYLTILVTIGSGMYMGSQVIRHESFPRKYRAAAVGGGAVLALFFIGFFSFHFCGFHAGHSAFLSSFFPIPGISNQGFADCFMNPFKLLGRAFMTLLPLYGIFLIPAIIAERENLLKPVRSAYETVQRMQVSGENMLQKKGEKTDAKQKAGADFMFGPYRNVIRMHLLIFFFAGAHFMKLDHFAVYAVVYAVYFFPWREFRRKRG